MEGSARSSAETSQGLSGTSASHDSSTVQFSQAQNRHVQEDKAEAMKVLRPRRYVPCTLVHTSYEECIVVALLASGKPIWSECAKLCYALLWFCLALLLCALLLVSLLIALLSFALLRLALLRFAFFCFASVCFILLCFASFCFASFFFWFALLCVAFF